MVEEGLHEGSLAVHGRCHQGGPALGISRVRRHPCSQKRGYRRSVALLHPLYKRRFTVRETKQHNLPTRVITLSTFLFCSAVSLPFPLVLTPGGYRRSVLTAHLLHALFR